MVEGSIAIAFPDREVEVFMPLDNILIKVGKVDLKEKYLFRAGGLFPKTMDELKYIFDNWDTISYSEARQVYVEYIINQ